MSGSVTFKGTKLDLEGNFPSVGAAAPDAELVDGGLQEINLSKFSGKTRVIISVPSLDTPVCDVETRRFNNEVAALDGVELVAVSMDLPFAQQRWCGSAAAENVQALSDYKKADFGLNYGVLIKPLRLLARAVFVVGSDDTIKYAELVSEVADHPDYDAALNAVKGLL